MNYITIENNAGLRSYLEKFEEKGLHMIALDIEAESNLHAYGEKLCLAQIFDGVNNIVIDALKIDNNILKLLFENTKVLKVMYDAGSDMSLLKNAAGMEIKSILDLRPAADLLDYEKKDLHSVIAAELGIILDRKKKHQRRNWTKRPLSEEALAYALNDVMHLLALKDIIFAKLYAKKLLEPFLLKNLQIQSRDYTRGPEDRYRKIKGYGRLREGKKAVFRRVFDIRDRYARMFNMTPHNVIHKADMLRIAEDPRFIDTMRFTKRISDEAVQRMVKELKAATKGGK